MVNIPLDQQAFIYFRHWLRTETQIKWRDLSDACLIPTWNEAICKQEILDNDNTTPGQRAWLTIQKNYSKLDLRWRDTEIKYLDLRPPKLYMGEYHGSLFACDIRRAYCKIYRYLYLHADFPSKRLKYPLREISETLQEDKLGRNAVMGIIRSTHNKWVQGQKVWYEKKHNRFLSPVLWAHVILILSEIAQKLEDMGAIHINTDGFTFTTAQQLQSAVCYLEDYGFEVKTFIGEGSITGIHGLIIPGQKEPKEVTPSLPVRHIEQSDYDLLNWWFSLSQKGA